MAMPIPDWESQLEWDCLSNNEKRERFEGLIKKNAGADEWLAALALERPHSSLRLEMEDRAVALAISDPDTLPALLSNVLEEDDAPRCRHLCNCQEALALHCGTEGCSSASILAKRVLARELRKR
jgi:hypothetical protein